MFHYYTPPFTLPVTRDGRAVAVLPAGIRGKPQLLASVGSVLGFPPHFGKNFDAFWDCLRDLPDDRKNTVLVHPDLPRVRRDDLEIYLELLGDAALEAWFPETVKERVMQLTS